MHQIELNKEEGRDISRHMYPTMRDQTRAIDEQTFQNRSSRWDRPKSFAKVGDREVGPGYIGLFGTTENSQKFNILLLETHFEIVDSL